MLVEALRDNDHGVRFAAAHTLAYVGDAAVPALLRALAQPDTDVVLRKGATIVISESTSPKVRQQGQPLLSVFKGSTGRHRYDGSRHQAHAQLRVAPGRTVPSFGRNARKVSFALHNMI